VIDVEVTDEAVELIRRRGGRMAVDFVPPLV
jgi:hypothetical protein